MLQRACLRQGLSFCKAISCLKYMHSKPDLRQIKLVVNLNQEGLQSKKDLKKFLDPIAVVHTEIKSDERIAEIHFRSKDETIAACMTLRNYGFSANYESYELAEPVYRQIMLRFPPDIDPSSFIENKMWDIEDVSYGNRRAVLTFRQEYAAKAAYHSMLPHDSIKVYYMDKGSLKHEDRFRRQLWVVCHDRNMEESEFSALLQGTGKIYRYEKNDRRLAQLTFESEEEADAHFAYVMRQKLPEIDAYFVGTKRIEVRRKTRIVLFPSDENMTREEMYQLSDDIVYVHYAKNDFPFQSKAYLDFESEKKMKENFARFLKMNLDVSLLGRKWLLPEDMPKALYIEFSGLGITDDEVAALSPDIIKFRLKRKATGQSYAKVVFDSVEVMERNFMQLEKKGYTVGHVGKRRWKEIYEKADRTLCLKGLPSNTTKEGIQAFSDDIVKVVLRFVTYDRSHAFVEFPSKEIAERNLTQFVEKGITAELSHVNKIEEMYPDFQEVDEQNQEWS